MAELIVIRHGQASFGADNYDRLSPAGHEQSRLAGALLRARGWVPDRIVVGSLVRQLETLNSMGYDNPEIHAGFNEYDFHNLLHTRYNGEVPDLVMGDRKTHFRTLRETIFEWQDGGLAGASESWLDFTTRTEDALATATREGAERVLVVSSGGVIGQTVASVVGAAPKMMMTLNLQVKNTSMTKIIFSGKKRFLHEFNATPHLDSPEFAEMLTYS
ncbi:histidine phosphatase family protein [Neptunicoccus cionae]|uniref:histidine phosphatase family protein n=1 Tax=Neptunicoccus cionae TaxID=2035344 RepID=UPI000C757EA6|nr:histidine phosphatase family protein [Amylibacter cionae]PLS20399.1 phosphoglycerate mutase [Amylibacter cionae]